MLYFGTDKLKEHISIKHKKQKYKKWKLQREGNSEKRDGIKRKKDGIKQIKKI